MGPEFSLLKVENLTCFRGGRALFANRSFEMQPGAFFVLRGPNGAGKSSMLRVLAGLLEPDEGHYDILEGFHFVGHQDAIKSQLTVRENLDFWARVMGDADVETALAAFRLESLANEPAGILSQGQRHRLSLSRLVLVQRGVWLLDEPSVGLDEENVTRLADLIKSQTGRGGVVLAATHVDFGVKPAQVITLGDL